MIVERFLQWIGSADAGRRAAAAHALARSFLYSPLAEAERDGIEAALTILLDDPAPEVRTALAEEIAANDKAPHHLVLSLAADEASIAAIVAEQSPLILDGELVDMLATREELVQIAIARRPFVSRALSAAVAEVGSEQACLALLSNGGARLPRFSLDRIVERHGDHKEIRDTLLAREDLPLVIRQTILARISDTIRDYMVTRKWVGAERADMVMRDARERATIAIAFEAPLAEIPSLVQRLMATDELTPAFLIRAAASGQAALFEAALAALAGVPAARVAALVSSGRAANLRGLLHKARLPPRSFDAFVAAVDVIRGDTGGEGASSNYKRATRLIDRILQRYGNNADHELDQILALLRRFATDAKRDAARGFAQEVLQAA